MFGMKNEPTDNQMLSISFDKITIIPHSRPPFEMHIDRDLNQKFQMLSRVA